MQLLICIVQYCIVILVIQFNTLQINLHKRSMRTDAVARDLSVDSARGIVRSAVVHWIACGICLIAERAAHCRECVDRAVGAARIVRWFSGRRYWTVVWNRCENEYSKKLLV